MTDLLRKLDGDPIYGYIYCIQNRLNGKIYFGQTINNFKRRYSKGISKTHNQHLSNSISKYGIENFTINEHFDVAHSMQELNELEEMYIKMYQTTNAKYGYNKKQGGDNKKYTQESKDKISRALMGKYSYENNPKAKKIICLTTGEVFSCIKNAKEKYQCSKIRLSTIEHPVHSGKDEKGRYLEWYDYDYFLNNQNILIIGHNLRQDKNKGEQNPVYGLSPNERMSKDTYLVWREKQRLNKIGAKNPNAKGKVMGYSMDECKVIVLQNATQCKSLGFDYSCVRKCINGRLGQHKGYVWKALYCGEGDKNGK